MRLDIYLDVEVYKEPTGQFGEGTYYLKVHVMPIDYYLDYKFTLFHANKGEYELYPGSYKEKSTDKWKDKFEYSKQTPFHIFLLDEVIDAIEVCSGEIITRTHDEKYKSLQAVM